MTPVKAEAVASVTMKPLMPVRAVRRPLISPPRTPIAERDRDSEPQRHAKDLHHAAEQDGDQAAERADRQVHLADGERDHLREGDDHADADAAQQHVEIEFGQEIRRDDGKDDRADDDRRQQARPFGIEDAAQRSGPLHPGARRQSAAIALDQHRRQKEQPEEQVQPEIADAQDEQAAADRR